MEIKSEKELIEWVYEMHLQNLNGREDFVDAFKQGIEATIEELEELKFLNLPFVVGRSEQLKCGVLGGVCPYETGDRLCRAEFKCENQVAF